MPDYQFLTNHAQVLLCVAHDPGIRLRDIAETVGITERSAHRIVSELVEDGYIARERTGRRNVYKVEPELPLLHPLAQQTAQRKIGDLLEVLLAEDGKTPARARGKSRRTAGK
ncbi:helix-turn-helix transcriptional regulator [Acinetobacter baumannii]|uniref:helix-turn-helix transcriptional regulator n=1 Tax=Acinetobacter baumannii TaxID=470 RepID=UPI00189816BD|nr:winged helix-turn-helix domain-containing protein [Acinetobacter baumannii]MBF6841845.1 winged helix-turn-helix domain-containing protein [Acinetobacter baumannii]